ncbi:hypothetical protein BCEP27_20838 [Burkholderia cepacia]
MMKVDENVECGPPSGAFVSNLSKLSQARPEAVPPIRRIGMIPACRPRPDFDAKTRVTAPVSESS